MTEITNWIKCKLGFHKFIQAPFTVLNPFTMKEGTWNIRACERCHTFSPEVSLFKIWEQEANGTK